MRYFFIVLLLAAFGTQAQTAKKVRYFNNQGDRKEVPSERAHYAEYSWFNPDGSNTVELRYIKNDVVVQSETYNNGMPVGHWHYANIQGKTIRDLDYRFETRYAPENCTSDYRFEPAIGALDGRNAAAAQAPRLIGERTFFQFLARELHYPEPARAARITGTVMISGRLTKEGILTDLVITNKADRVLAAEAIRVVSGASRWTPAMVDGQPVEVCWSTPVTFKL